MITSKIESITYANGKRQETVVFECSLSDDYVKMGQLHTSLGQRLAKKEQLLPLYDKAAKGQEAGYDKVSLDEEFERLDKEIAACRELIAKQQEYVNGYKGDTQ